MDRGKVRSAIGMRNKAEHRTVTATLEPGLSLEATSMPGLPFISEGWTLLNSQLPETGDSIPTDLET